MTVLVIETSVLIAISMEEPNASNLLLEIQNAEFSVCPANCVAEAMVVLVRKGRASAELAREQILALLQSLDISVAPFDERAMHHALEGYMRYGKGTGKAPAVLNFGDCLSYGVAKAAGGKLLFTGDDFAQTDMA
jgi:ribonuclease VapC